MRAWVRSLLPLERRAHVTFEPRVPPHTLGERVADHHVGLALETGGTPNLALTVSNKICHYLQCGLAVAATNTVGQREVMSQVEHAGVMVPVGAV